MTDILVPIAPGELIDKLTILRIKADKITDPGKRAHVLHEMAMLDAVANQHVPASPELTVLWQQLSEINTTLWQIEDDIRASDAREDFGDAYIALARAVYVTNDKRAAIKKKINLLLGSSIVEEKSYHGAGST